MSPSIDEELPAMMFAPWVECTEERCRGGRVLITAVNHREGTAMHLDPADLDPRSGDRYRATMLDLAEGRFVDEPGTTEVAPAPRKAAGAGLVWRGADRCVRRGHDAGLRRAFDRSWIAAQFVLAVVGALAFVLTLRSDGFELHAHPAQIPAIILLGLVAVAIHELGHALVTVHYGRRVRMVGLRLHLGTPAFYVESVDALLLNRRQRLIQAAAGPWAEWLVTSAAAIVFLVIPHDTPGAAILHRFVIINAIGIAANLLPFVGLDGALLLADALHQPDLPFRARGALLAPAGRRRERWLTAYATANAMAATALLVMAGFFWWQLFGSLGKQLWSSGPAGVALVLVASALLGRQLVAMIAPALTVLRHSVARRWSNLVFRLERRWRVRAINAFRALPAVAELDATALGIVAGHLQRVGTRSNAAEILSGHVYVHRAPRRGCPSPTNGLTKGVIAEFGSTCRDALERGATLVLLPDTWQHLVARP